MGKPRLLDLFCGAGGCSAGYAKAGFEVVGVDLQEQPRYPFEFHKGGSLGWLEFYLATKEWPCGGSFDAIHASPPCPGYSKLAAMHPGKSWPLLIAPVKDLLQQIGLPWVIENVPGAPLASAPTPEGDWGVVLCGSMFGLGSDRGYLRRHRVFETSFPLPQPKCNHEGVAVGVYGRGGTTGRHRMLYRKEASEAMGIDWMNHYELTQAIPPAYTEFVGRGLMRHIKEAGSA
jgi:DNA (cytosine-5)-methyltransferase 1